MKIDYRSCYWKLLFVPKHEEIVSSSRPILIGRKPDDSESITDEVLRASRYNGFERRYTLLEKILKQWNEELDEQNRAAFGIVPFNSHQRLVQRQHENPLEKGYHPLWAERDNERFQNEDPERYKQWLDEVANRRTPLSPDWTEEDWDREIAKKLAEIRDDRRWVFKNLWFGWKHLPFIFSKKIYKGKYGERSWGRQIRFWIYTYTKEFFQYIDQYPIRYYRHRQWIDFRQQWREEWRTDKARHEEYWAYRHLHDAVYQGVEVTGIRSHFDRLKDAESKGDTRLQEEIAAMKRFLAEGRGMMVRDGTQVASVAL
jgi:hypothetical protein